MFFKKILCVRFPLNAKTALFAADICYCYYFRCKSVNNVTLRSRGVGPLGRQTEKEREEQREGVGCSRAQGRGLEQSQHDDSIQHIARPPHTTSSSSPPVGEDADIFKKYIPSVPLN